MNSFTRREFLLASGSAIAAAACEYQTKAPAAPDIERALLKSRPGAPPRGNPATGLHPLGLATGRDGFIYMPKTYSPDKPAPLIILMHGAGQDASEWARPELSQILDPGGVVGIIPESRFPTWDMIYSDYGPDVRFIDQALALAFKQCRIDSKKIAIGGFSDGATYALSLGIANADLFSTILAFSPGFVKPAAKRGKPRIFIAHGTRDQILPIDMTSREIVAALKEKNYPVRFDEFDGPHTVTLDEAKKGMAWFLEG
ncbi:MAG: phospholipase [Gemmatimonadales bacterium]